MISIKQTFQSLSSLLLIVTCPSNFASLINNDATAVIQQTRASVGAMFDEKIVAANVRAVRTRAATMPASERFDCLLRWVLPTESHSTIRMTGEFTQSDQTPDVNTLDTRDAIRSGVVISPVFDLLNLAKKLNRLPEIQRTVEAVADSSDEEQLRARAGLLVLIHLELNQQEAAIAAAQDLLLLVMKNDPVGMADQWPETLVAYRVIAQFGDHVTANDLIAYLYARRAQRELPKGCRTWHNQISSLAGQQAILSNGSRLDKLRRTAGLSQWVSVSREMAITHGLGYSEASWRRRAERVDNVSAHDDEYLFFQSPLQGDFEVECDLMAPNIGRADHGGREIYRTTL